MACLGALRSLQLTNTHVTSAGLAHLSRLRNLEWLDLDDTQIGDSGLEHLKELHGLKFLNVKDTHVTDSGAVWFHKALPDCLLYR